MAPIGASATIIFGSGPGGGDTPPVEPGDRAPWSLRGDPSFDPNNLNSTAKLWHTRLLAYLSRVSAKTDHAADNSVRGHAQNANLYNMARDVRGVVFTLMLAFRATGDLAILDTIKLIVDDMKAQLSPGWRGTIAVPSGAPGGNGYIEPGQWSDGIWVWKTGGSPEHTGRDIHPTDDPKTISIICYYALACEMNRDIAVKYANDADYWSAFLVNWEAKWRSNRWQRRNRPTGPMFRRGHTHSQHGEMTLYVLLHRLTDENKYLNDANTLYNDIWASDFRLTTVDGQQAYVWARTLQSLRPGDENYLHPATYARYVFDDTMTLHLEGYQTYASTTTMQRLANSVARMLISNSNPSSSSTTVTNRDIGGGVTRAGIPSDSSWSGINTLIWAGSAGYGLLEKFDSSGIIGTLNSNAYSTMGYGESPRGVIIPVAKLVASI